MRVATPQSWWCDVLFSPRATMPQMTTEWDLDAATSHAQSRARNRQQSLGLLEPSSWHLAHSQSADTDDQSPLACTSLLIENDTVYGVPLRRPSPRLEHLHSICPLLIHPEKRVNHSLIPRALSSLAQPVDCHHRRPNIKKKRHATFIRYVRITTRSESVDDARKHLEMVV